MAQGCRNRPEYNIYKSKEWKLFAYESIMWQGWHYKTNGEGWASQQMAVGQLPIYIENNENSLGLQRFFPINMLKESF